MPGEDKYLVLLTTEDGRKTVVISWSPSDARTLAWAMSDLDKSWLAAECEIIIRVPSTRTSQILAMEKSYA